jgi:REP-associated tyrosine transposase
MEMTRMICGFALGRGMARAARLVLPDVPHHVTQRGNRRQRTFFLDSDYQLYISLLRFWCAKAGTAIWAWCLMPNHVHLILVPSNPDGLRAAVANTHRRYTWQINQREEWRGNLWQTRFASFPMDEAHLHACVRYVELNPVRAGLAERAEQWPWSSARAHLGLGPDPLTLLAPMRERIDDWRAMLDSGLDEDERKRIRASERSGQPLGDARFLARLGALARGQLQ